MFSLELGTMSDPKALRSEIIARGPLVRILFSYFRTWFHCYKDCWLTEF